MANAQPELVPLTGWAERVAERSPTVQQSRHRSIARANQIVQAARRLVVVHGNAFTTHQLVKEAGVAIQTFYKYFASKDHVLLAVVEEWIAEGCDAFAEHARDLPGPLDRLRFYVTVVLAPPQVQDDQAAGPRFVASEHWRLQQIFPEEMVQATRPFTEMLLPEIRVAAEMGLLKPRDPEQDAWLVTQLVMAVYHQHAFAASTESSAALGEALWLFCLAALGGSEAAEARRPVQRSRRRTK